MYKVAAISAGEPVDGFFISKQALEDLKNTMAYWGHIHPDLEKPIATTSWMLSGLGVLTPVSEVKEPTQ